MAVNWLAGLGSMFRAGAYASPYEAARANVAAASNRELPPMERYALQRAYYANNGLYQDLARALYEAGIASRAIRGLRNPAFRICEFYPAHLWPGDLPDALPIQTENDRIIEPIHKIWRWSNWARKKQVLARWLPMLGDSFIKVVRPDGGDRVYFQLIDPAHVTAFAVDERDNLTWARIDIPITRPNGKLSERALHTEVWSKADQSYRQWEHTNSPQTPLEELGTPAAEAPFSQWGIDFVPIVHIPFRDIGEDRGAGAYIFQIDKIDQLNADATRLKQMLFRHNKPTLVFIGGKDPDNRPLPAPRVATTSTNNSLGEGAGDALELRDESALSLPGDTRVESLVPNINYDAHLKDIDQDVLDLQHDCPEMAYWSVMEMGAGQISGRALNYILSPAIKRAEEARGNGEDGMIRAAEMALTLGTVGTNLFGSIGTYDQGDFEHMFEARPVIPVSGSEEAETDRSQATAAQAWKAAGLPLSEILRRNGYTDEQIVEILNAAAGQTDPNAPPIGQ